MWYAPDGVDPQDIYSYREFKYMPYVAEEVKAIRHSAAMIEMSSMAKFEVSGKGAYNWLDSVLANDCPKRQGQIALSHLLSKNGGIRCEFTVTRLDTDLFSLIATPGGEAHDFDCLRSLLPDDGSVVLRNATWERGCFTIVGPKSREVLQPLTETDMSNEAFPWLTARTVDLGLASDVRMMRVNYEGELGWECYHPIFYQHHLYDLVMQSGQSHGLVLAGNRAIESTRLDKSYRAMYRDLNTEHTVVESGMQRFVKFEKDRDFPGRQAVEKQIQNGIEKKLVTLKVDCNQANAYMNEGVYCDGKLVGRVSSGGQSYHFDHGISMAYINIAYSDAGTELEIPILNEPRPATVIADSPYDPGNLRSRM